MGVGLHTELFQSAQRLHHLYRRAMSAAGSVGAGSDLATAAACLLLASEQEECVLDANVLAARAGTRALTPTLEAIVACIGEAAGLVGLSQACAVLAWERLQEPLARLQAQAVAAAPASLRAQLAATSPVTIAGLLLAVVKALGLPPRLVGVICTRLHANRQQSQRCAELISSLTASQLNALEGDEGLVEHLRTQRIKRLKSRPVRPLTGQEGEEGQPTVEEPSMMPQSTTQSCKFDYSKIHAAHELGYTWMVTASPASDRSKVEGRGSEQG